ncbi:MAG: hemolysin family protein, partial [Oscillospiraceae bacterium]
IRLKNQGEDGDKKALLALKIIEDYDSSLAALLVANNVVNILSASLTTLFFTNLLGAGGVGVATALTTVAVIIFGEVMPKSFANENAENILKSASSFLNLLLIVLKPVTKVLNFITISLKKRQSQSGDSTPTVTEQELMSIIDEIEDEGVFEEDEADLVQSAIEFNDICASEALTPRVDIFALSKDDDAKRVKDMFLAYNFSRLPVYDGSIDHIIGFVNQKDFFAKILKNEEVVLAELIKPCVYVPPKKKIIDIMHLLQRQEVHMAVVTDEYGGTLGILTLEDILEELVGDIWDEHDEVTQFIRPLEDGSFEALGEISMADLYEAILSTHTSPIKETISLSAYLLEHLNKIPDRNEVFTDAYFRYTVLEITENRIIKILVTVLTENDFEI